MATYSLVWTATFLRTVRKLLRRHPELEGVLLEVLEQLEDAPYSPKLRLHRLEGKHRDKQAISLTFAYRIVLVLRVRKKEAVLLDIGTHDEVYGG